MPCSSPSVSPNVQNILADAKKLVGRLHDHDNTAESVISQAQALSKKIEAMKEYKEDVNKLNEIAHQIPRSALLVGIQQENRHIRQLQQENRELKILLDDHQTALELIMSKYREHMTQLLTVAKVHKLGAETNLEYESALQKEKEKVCEMLAVMTHAVTVGNEESVDEQERLARLAVENQGLRELLNIALKEGSVNSDVASDILQKNDSSS